MCLIRQKGFGRTAFKGAGAAVWRHSRYKIECAVL